MQKVRKTFDTSIAKSNAKHFGYSEYNIRTCPHCGKAYRIHREIRVFIDEIDNITLGERKTDDWGR